MFMQNMHILALTFLLFLKRLTDNIEYKATFTQSVNILRILFKVTNNNNKQLTGSIQ